jgi:malonyl-CoA O-methyltransferase
MKVQNAFSSNAKTYDEFNIIQTRIIKELTCTLYGQPRFILDIGCGSGGMYKAIPWSLKRFVGIDFAEGMLELHPKNESVMLLAKDFNDEHCFEEICHLDFDRIVSASALQWAEDLDAMFKKIAAFNVPVSLAIFTSGTFKTLYETAAIPPLLRSADQVKALAQKYFNAQYELKQYTLEFSSVREMFRYMKKSGVSGGRNVLNYKQMKALMSSYPLDYLEFEILIISEDSVHKV